ncbi:putative heterokaryon incompatibility protein [Rosellinia necatrix]|uniref:Putative heterokaryon incompatibility protein n=1 Tax=Rosellinia necatrix TaxID=77044 RepID=A0A1W2TTT6_ROSNE|nr:putative heterokaryon incompatibility protein [Rosellinia necatrix]
MPENIGSDESESHCSSQPAGYASAGTTPSQSHSRPHAPPHASSLSRALSPKVYPYKNLDTLEFRLVRILPKTMFVKYKITTHSLIDPPPYIAISYAWGDADDKRAIRIDGIVVSVAVSLWEALNAVQKQDDPVLVWVDALCINQQDRDERSQQVQLMTEIYAKATEVAIWLGPPEDDSELAMEFLKDIAMAREDPQKITNLLSPQSQLPALRAVVFLFQRDYWERLWVVQEVFNARDINVHCGNLSLPWEVYKKAAQVFQQHKRDLNSILGDKHQPASQNFYSYSQALAYQGPNSLYDFESLDGFGEEALLNVMRACRRKLSAEPRDKIFGILGVLPNSIREAFTVDYKMSVKNIYTDVVGFLLKTTECLDVICESIHFPKQTSITKLPSWVPDWSQYPGTTALGYSHNFTAAGSTRAECRLLGERRNELEISAVLVDAVSVHGIAVGTICTFADYLMAFLHWHALLMEFVSSKTAEQREEWEEVFCKTLCLGQIPPNTMDKSRDYSVSEWKRICYHVFAAQLHSRLPQIILSENLRDYVDVVGLKGNFDPRQFLQDNFASRMMGRCFFLTLGDCMGMGTGFMLPHDVIVVPLGCRTPIVLRKEESKRGRYKFIGDVYLNGYMNGKAMEMLKTGERKVEKFVLI